MNARCRIIDAEGKRGPQVEMMLVEERISPEVDETWTKADVRKLIQLLKKREKLLEKLEKVIQDEHSWEFDYHDDLRRILEGKEL